jgi:anthranilate phosphoribosyltransferase
MTFKEEQGHLQNAFSHLALYLHQRNTSKLVRDIVSGEVSEANVSASVLMHSLLRLNYRDSRSDMLKMLEKAVLVVKNDIKIDGKGNDYYSEPLPIVTESLPIVAKSLKNTCEHCNFQFESKSSKKRFCSENCKIRAHRKKNPKNN